VLVDYFEHGLGDQEQVATLSGVLLRLLSLLHLNSRIAAARYL
jgi:hypothetical protein